MKRLRGVLFADPAIVLATIFFGTVSLVVSFFDQTGATQIRVARAWARTLLAVSGVRVRVEGLEQIDPAGSYVFISNHLSYMDTPVALAHIPVQFRFLAKRGLFQIPFLGQHLSRAGHIPVPREDPRAAVKSMQIAAEAIQQKKISLLIFPEGGRSHDGDPAALQRGRRLHRDSRWRAGCADRDDGDARGLPFGAAIVQSGLSLCAFSKPIETAQLTLKDRGAV